MSYEKYTKYIWTDGEIITANKLNHIEDGIKTNEIGYQQVEEIQTIYDGSIFISYNADSLFDFNYHQISKLPIFQNSLTIKFNNIEYQLPKAAQFDSFCVYGEWNQIESRPIFQNFPCAITFSFQEFQPIQFSLMVPSEGYSREYQLKVEGKFKTIKTSQTFKQAVLQIINEYQLSKG